MRPAPQESAPEPASGDFGQSWADYLEWSGIDEQGLPEGRPREVRW